MNRERSLKRENIACNAGYREGVSVQSIVLHHSWQIWEQRRCGEAHKSDRTGRSGTRTILALFPGQIFATTTFNRSKQGITLNKVKEGNFSQKLIGEGSGIWWKTSARRDEKAEGWITAVVSAGEINPWPDCTPFLLVSVDFC